MADKMALKAAFVALEKPAQRHPHIDLVKSLAILAVVFAHCFPTGAILTAHVSDRILAFVVPSFFACSGLLYARVLKTKEDSPVGSTIAALPRHLGRLLCPYVCATVCVWIARSTWEWKGRPALSWRTCLTELLLGDAAAPYYFIFELAVFVLLTPLLAACSPGMLQGLLVLVVALHTWLKVGLAHALGIPFEWSIRLPLYWWGYFLVGWMSPLLPTVRSWQAFVIIVGLFLVEAAAPSEYTALLLAYGFCIFIPQLIPPGMGIPCSTWVLWLSNNTYTIMLYHPIFVELAKAVILGEDPNELVYVVEFSWRRVMEIWSFSVLASVALAFVAPRLLGPTPAKCIFGCMPQSEASSKLPQDLGPTAALLAHPRGISERWPQSP